MGKGHYVAGFAPDAYDPWTPPSIISDWPTVWVLSEAWIKGEEVSHKRLHGYSTLTEAEEAAKEKAEACIETPPTSKFGISWETVFLYGPFTQESVYILSEFGEDVCDQVRDFQFTLAMDLLLPCTLALKSLTPEFRRMVY